jgi:hypothetical protein
MPSWATIEEYLEQVGLSESERNVAKIKREKIFENDIDSTTKQFYASTKLSLNYNSLNIEKFKSISGEFIYNYFERDEKTKPAGVLNQSSFIDIINIDNLGDDKYSIITKRKPRYIKLKIDFGNFDTSSDDIINFDQIINQDSYEFATPEEKNIFIDDPLYPNKLIENIKKYIIYEGNLSNGKTTGIEYFDTFGDKKIYNIFSSSIVFQNIGNSTDSLTTLSRKFIDSLEEKQGKFDLAQKQDLLSVLTNLNAKGISISGNDNNIKVEDSLSNISISTKFNNLFIADMVENATITSNYIFADENQGLLNASPALSEIQNAAIDTIVQENSGDMSFFVSPLPGTLRAVELDELWETESEQLDSIINNIDNYPIVKICGIMINCYEINNGVPQLQDTRIIKNIENFNGEFIYEHVKYGKTYLFKLRLIALVDTIFDIENNLDAFAFGSFLMLSDSISAYTECTETIPPEPPSVIRVNMDYESQKPELTWDFPLNMQRDIKKFQIYKRKNINEPFVLLQVNDFDNSEIKTPSFQNIQTNTIKNYTNSKLWPNKFIDYDFNIGMGKNFDYGIYAIISVDAHGMTSGYSSQLFIKYDKLSNRFISEIISKAGAPQPYPNLFIKQDFFDDVIKQSNYTRCNIFFDPEYYKLLRTIDESENTTEEIDYIAFTDDNDISSFYPYQFHFINIDNQVDQTFEINISDKSGLPDGTPAASVNQNYTFDFSL